MDINDIKEKLETTVALKIKRAIRVLRRPFIRTKLDYSMDIYKTETDDEPVSSVTAKSDTDIKLFDLACALAGVMAVMSVLRSLFKIFR